MVGGTVAFLAHRGAVLALALGTAMLGACDSRPKVAEAAGPEVMPAAARSGMPQTSCTDRFVDAAVQGCLALLAGLEQSPDAQAMATASRAAHDAAERLCPGGAGFRGLGQHAGRQVAQDHAGRDRGAMLRACRRAVETLGRQHGGRPGERHS